MNSPASDEAVGRRFFDFEPLEDVGAVVAATASRRWRRAPRRRRGRVARERGARHAATPSTRARREHSRRARRAEGSRHITQVDIFGEEKLEDMSDEEQPVQ